MSFFAYRQNNSGGSFMCDENVAHLVVIEAADAATADALAETHGIYFDGVESGQDCSCCGDRWDRAWKHSSTELALAGQKTYFHDKAIVYHANGRVDRYETVEGKLRRVA